MQGDLTCCVCVAREASYGIQDKFIGNTDIRLNLFLSEMLEKTQIEVNGEPENYERDTDEENYFARRDAKPVPKEDLAAAKPIKWVTRNGWYLSFHYDWKVDYLKMKLQGADAEKLPLAKQKEHIFRNKVVDTDTRE